MCVPSMPYTSKPSILTTIATFSTMVGGVISDIYHAEDRNTPMALFSGAALFGTGLAPLLSSVIVHHTTWRWIYYSHAIVSAALVFLIFLFFSETRGSVLLSRKAKALNTYYEKLESAGYYGVVMPGMEADEGKVKRLRWKVKSDEQKASLVQMIGISCYRPFRELSTGHLPSSILADSCRYVDHGACCLLLLSMGCLQLGCLVSPVQFSPTGLQNKPQLQHPREWSRVHMYDPCQHLTKTRLTTSSNLRRHFNHHHHKHLPRTNRQALRDDP